MGIVAAIARVRAGAKSAGLEGALHTLGAELKSDAIPERFRDVAGRLAALLGPNPRSSRAEGSAVHAPVPSLEVALAQHANLRANAPGDAVCPFTGLRADEMGAQHHAAAARIEATTTAAPAVAEEAIESAAGAAHDAAPASADAEPPTLAHSDDAPTAEARAETQDEAAADGVAEAAPRTLTSSSEPASAEAAAVAAAATQAARARPAADASPSRKEKRKERLAGAGSVENTSARSATRSAPKRPRGKADGSRKKT